MSFASPMFLWYFLPAVLAAVLIAPRNWRNGVVAAASLVFYAVGAGPTTVLLLGCMLVNFVIGPALEPDDWDLEPQRRRRLLIAVIGFDLAVLFVWKYAGFASAQAAGLATSPMRWTSTAANAGHCARRSRSSPISRCSPS